MLKHKRVFFSRKQREQGEIGKKKIQLFEDTRIRESGQNKGAHGEREYEKSVCKFIHLKNNN